MANQKGFSGATILELEAKGDFFTRRILIEQKRVEDIDAALSQVRNDISYLRLKTKSGAIDVLNLHRTTPNPAYQRADGVDPTGLADQNQKKLASNLEMRLNKILIRHSEVINNNARLKGQINQLRREHVTASEVHNQFEAGIKEAQRETSAMLARASLINDHREELVKAKEDLLAQNRETKERFTKRMDNLSEIIEMESDRFEATMEREGKNKKDVISALAAVEKAGSLTVEEEHEERSRLKQVEDAEKKERANEKSIEAKIKWYEEAFKELKAASNIDDLDRLIKVFLKQEDEHFSLFNYIQTVNQETDQHLEKTERLEVEIKNFEEEQNVEERQRVAIIRDLHERVEMQRASDQAWAKKVEEAQSMVDGLVKKAHSICFKTQCDQYLQTAFKDATGERAAELQSMNSTLAAQGINVSNVVDYMGLIEQRSIQVIANYAKWLATKDPDSNPIRGPLQPPSWELQEGSTFPDVSEDDESEGGDGTKSSDGPLSMSETRKEMQKRMEKKVARIRRKAGLLQTINSRSTGSLPKEL